MAKIDSGNGGYNVLHGEDVVQQGDVITFRTYNHKNEMKMISKKLKEFIQVNIGSGNIEERPVVELDVKFAGDLYKKIPFSIANRSSNSHKILICKDFVQNELDALIDVGGKSITKDKVEVEYMTEAADTEQTDPGAVKKAVHNAKKGIKGFFANMQSVGNKIGAATIGGVDDLKPGEKKKVKDLFDGYANQAAQDAELIRKKAEEEGKPADYGIDTEKLSGNDVLCFKLVDFTGKYWGGGEKTVPSEQQTFDQYQEMIKGAKGEGKKDLQADDQKEIGNQKNESFEQKIARMITEEDFSNGGTFTMASGNSNQPQQANPQQQAQQQKPQQKKEEKKDDKSRAKDQAVQVTGTMEELQQKYELRNKFFVYYVEIEQDAVANKDKREKAVTEALNKMNMVTAADNLFLNLGKQSIDSKNMAIETFVAEVESGLQNAGLAGTFAFCYTPEEERTCILLQSHIITKEEAEKAGKTADPAEIERMYNEEKAKWEKNLFLKHIKLDVNGKYDNEEVMGKLQSVAEGKIPQDEAEPQQINASFTPYLDRYCKRLYGNNIYLYEDATEEQPNVEAEQKQSGPEGEDILAQLDVDTIAKSDKDNAPDAADQAIVSIKQIRDYVQTPYFNLTDEEKESITLKPYEPTQQEEPAQEQQQQPQEEQKEEEQKSEEEKDIVQEYNTILDEWKNNPFLKYVSFTPKHQLAKDRINGLGRLINELNNAKDGQA